MRIDLACSSRELFGSDRSAVRLGRLLTGLGHEVTLLLPQGRRESGMSALARGAGLATHECAVAVASSRGFGGLRLAGRRDRGAELTIYNSAAIVAAPGDHRPRALIVREWLEPRWLRHRALAAWHRRRVDGAVAVSMEVAQRWRACAGDRVPVTVCPNWLDEDWLSGEPAARTRAGILFAGRLSPWKGQLTLADAYERAFGGNGARPPMMFLGAEDAPSPFHRHAEELRARCEANGWELARVAVDPRPMFARAALVVVPSLHPEPFGNVILEGLAAGARVVSFPGGGADDVAPHFPGVLEVVPRDTDALAAALRRWWDRGGTAQSQSEHELTRATLRARFSAEALAPRWDEMVARLAPDQARSASAAPSTSA